jgi:hypothetical protein
MDTVTKQISIESVAAYADIFVEALVENREPTGIDLDIESFMLDFVDNNPPADELTKQIYTLMDCLFSDDHSRTEHVLRYFLGRGGGSTPAGDDHIIGLLALHAITGALHPAFVQTVKTLTEQEEITTRSSHYYLRHALDGTFLDLVAHILHDMTNHRHNTVKMKIMDLLPIGHSSVIDTVFGILIGMLAVMKRRKQGKRA